MSLKYGQVGANMALGAIDAYRQVLSDIDELEMEVTL